MKNNIQSTRALNFYSGSVFSTLLVVFATLLGGSERSAAAIFPGQGDDSTPSMGVFRITVDPAFRLLMQTNGGFLAYAGYKPSDGKLTSPLCIDNATTIGRSGPHDRLLGGSVPVGLPSMGNVGYADYTIIPALFGTAPVGTREILTQIRSFLLESVTPGTAGRQCPPDPRVPAVPLAWPMVKAGPDQGLTLRSIGMVQESVPNGGADPDFPANSFFDIFVEVNLPPLPGTRSAVAFPVTGAVLYNDSPLVITNLGLTTLPPTVVYIHGETTAVPLKFRSTNPPYWTAGDVFGYLVLAGHGTVTDDCENTNEVTALLDAALGPIGSSAPEMPVEWLRPTNTCPSPGSTYDSVKNIDIIDFPVPGFGVIRARNFVHGSFPNPINPPPLGPPAFYNEPITEVALEVSPDGNNWSSAQAQGPVQVQIIKTTTSGPATGTFDTEMLQLNLQGNSQFGPFMIRESPTLPSRGRHFIRESPSRPGRYSIGSFFDVFLDLSLDGGMTWHPANRSIRVQPSAPAPAPNSIFISLDGPTVVLNWLGEFTLQSSTNVAGPYTDVPGPVTTGPYSPPMTESQMYFRLRESPTLPGFTSYDTEMLQLDISSGLPPGMLIRESPTLQSLGTTTVTPASGGGFLIDSFFDVFTEVSLDNGQSWQVSTSAPPRMRFTGSSQNNNLPPFESDYVSPADWHAAYAQGIFITNASHHSFTGSFPPPPPGGSANHSFGSTVNMEVRFNPGGPFQPLSVPAQVTVKVTSGP